MKSKWENYFTKCENSGERANKYMCTTKKNPLGTVYIKKNTMIQKYIKKKSPPLQYSQIDVGPLIRWFSNQQGPSPCNLVKRHDMDGQTYYFVFKNNDINKINNNWSTNRQNVGV